MENKIECLTCKEIGLEYKCDILTHTHLRAKHDMSIKEYKNKYNVIYMQSESRRQSVSDQSQYNWNNKELRESINTARNSKIKEKDWSSIRKKAWETNPKMLEMKIIAKQKQEDYKKIQTEKCESCGKYFGFLHKHLSNQRNKKGLCNYTIKQYEAKFNVKLKKPQAPPVSFKNGHIPWNKGLTKETDSRIADYTVKMIDTKVRQFQSGERKPVFHNTKPEQKVESKLKDMEVAYKSQVCIKRDDGTNYTIVDFVVGNICIFVDGDYWHCNPKKYDKDYYHSTREMFAFEIWNHDNLINIMLESKGYKVIRMYESEIDSVISGIALV